MRHNILITSAGKRVELLLEFKKELKLSFPHGQIIAVDLNPQMAPACHLADKFYNVPRVTNPEYVDRLLKICIENNVRLVIPTIDTELEILSAASGQFKENGIEIMISDHSFISMCRDKRLTISFFDQIGIKTPALIDKFNPSFPLFAKPYDGSLSTNIHIIHSPQELTHEILSDPKLIFMELVDTSVYEEFTVDMYYGDDNEVKCIVPRKRIEIRSGEINKGATRKNDIIEYLYNRMKHLPGVRGCICIQLFYRESDGDIFGIEINPRFGGGYPLSYHAGANFPAMMIQEYIHEHKLVYFTDWQDNTIMLRYDSQVILHG